MNPISLREIIFIIFGYCCCTVDSVWRAFKTEPKNTTVIEGSSVVLNCTLITGYTDHPVYWEVNGNVLTQDTNKIERYKWIEDKSKDIHNLQILKASKDDEGSYVCVLHFPGTRNVTERSRPANLTVIQRPSFIEEHQDITVTEGRNVTLNCSIGKFTEETFNVFWLKNGVRVPSKTYFTHSNALPGRNESIRYSTLHHQGTGEFSLHINNVSIEDAGDFCCVVSLANGTDHLLESRKATLTVVHSKCAIYGPNPKKDIYLVGDNITAVCVVQGNQADYSMLISLEWSLSAASFQLTKLQGDNHQLQRTWSLTANDDNKSMLCRIKLPGTSREKSCSSGPLSVSTLPVIAIPSSATPGTDGPSSTFLIVACFLLVILVLVVLVLGVIYYITRRNRLKGRQNKTDDINLTETPRQQQSDEVAGGQNAAFSDLADARAINADMNAGSSPESHGQGHSVEDISTSDRQGEATYAQVDKRRKREKNSKPVDIDIEATITNENKPVASPMVLKSSDQESDRSCGKSEPTRRTDGLVYAELDIATSPTSNQRLVKVSEPPTIYADLKHPENKD